MPTDRQETLPAIWAEEAEELPISGNPVVGTTYRKEAIAPETIQAGWPYATINNSAEFNEVMRTITAMMRLLESWGMLPWSPATVYATGALVMGSNGTIYKALQATTNNDPVSSPTYWGVAFEVSGTSATHAALTSPHSATSEATASRLMVRDASGRCKVATPSTADQIARLDTVTGQISTHNAVTNPHSSTSVATPSHLVLRDASGRAKFVEGAASGDAVVFSQFANSKAASGYQKLPGGLILQWGTGSDDGSGVSVHVFPTPFPTLCAGVFAQIISANQDDRSVNVGNITTAGFSAYIVGSTIRWFAIGY